MKRGDKVNVKCSADESYTLTGVVLAVDPDLLHVRLDYGTGHVVWGFDPKTKLSMSGGFFLE